MGGFYANLNLKTKVLVVLGLTFTVTSAIIFFTVGFIISSGLLKVEQNNLNGDVQRVKKAIASQIDAVDTAARDWAAWDDLYDYMVDHNQNFEESNLQKDTVTTLKINYLLIADTNNKTVFSLGYDYLNDKELPMPQPILDDLGGQRKLFSHTNEEDLISGIFTNGSQKILLISRPIITSKHEGPIRGTLIFGKILDDTNVSSIEQITDVKINLVNLKAETIPNDFQEAINNLTNESQTSGIFYKVADQNTINAYTYLDTLSDTKGLILKVTTNREIFNQGGLSITYSFYALIGITIAFLTFTFIFMDLQIFRRLTKLSIYTKDIDKPNAPTQIVLTGKDELAQLNLTLNNLVASIRKNEDNLRKRELELIEANEKLHKINEDIKEGQKTLVAEHSQFQTKNKELESFNQLMIGREVKMSELKQQIEDLQAEIKKLKGETK